MCEIKYKDKALLDEYDLSSELFEQFQLKVKDVIPVRNVFLIKTNDGDYILKKIDYNLDELNFIIEATAYIKVKFPRIIDFKTNYQGYPYVKWKNDIYCIMEMLEGREGEFENPVDVAIVAKALGEFHKASKGFKTKVKERDNRGKSINNFSRRLEEIKFFKSIVNLYEHKNEFDILFLKHVDYYINEIEKSIKILEATDYYKLCQEEDKVAFCHQDLAHHNIIIRENEACFVDFDYSIIDLKVQDICNLINKAIKNVVYDFEKAELILTEYNKTNSLSAEELKVLYGLLTFPKDFYEISRDFYTRRKSWQEEVFIYKLNKKLERKQDNQEFLSKLENSLS